MFSQPGDQLVFFTLKTGSKTGKATIHLTANGGGQQTKETIEIAARKAVKFKAGAELNELIK